MARLLSPHPYGAATRRAGRNHARRVINRVDGAGSRRDPSQPSARIGSRVAAIGQRPRELPRVKLDREPLHRPSLGCPGEEVDLILELGRSLLDAGHDPGPVRMVLGGR